MKNAFDTIALEWKKCRVEKTFVPYKAIIPKAEFENGTKVLCKFSGTMFRGTIKQGIYNKEYWFGSIEWLTSKTRRYSEENTNTQDGCAGSTDDGVFGYSMSDSVVVMISNVNANPEAYYCKIT